MLKSDRLEVRMRRISIVGENQYDKVDAACWLVLPPRKAQYDSTFLDVRNLTLANPPLKMEGTHQDLQDMLAILQA